MKILLSASKSVAIKGIVLELEFLTKFTLQSGQYHVAGKRFQSYQCGPVRQDAEVCIENPLEEAQGASL